MYMKKDKNSRENSEELNFKSQSERWIEDFWD